MPLRVCRESIRRAAEREGPHFPHPRCFSLRSRAARFWRANCCNNSLEGGPKFSNFVRAATNLTSSEVCRLRLLRCLGWVSPLHCVRPSSSSLGGVLGWVLALLLVGCTEDARGMYGEVLGSWWAGSCTEDCLLLLLVLELGTIGRMKMAFFSSSDDAPSRRQLFSRLWTRTPTWTHISNEKMTTSAKVRRLMILPFQFVIIDDTEPQQKNDGDSFVIQYLRNMRFFKDKMSQHDVSILLFQFLISFFSRLGVTGRRAPRGTWLP